MGRRVYLLVLALMSVLTLKAQYYSQGSAPYYIKWNQRELSSGKLVYPDYFERGAQRLHWLYDSLTPTISYGMDSSTLYMPLVVHTENSSSNGLVMFAPKRMELITTPPVDAFASEWYAQLLAHEYRHVVQYSNLNSGFFKPLSWLIGQQSGLISLAMMPLWFLEGDAVMAETQATSFGRALQPSFTIAYRAYMDELDNDFSRDKWFTESYRDYIPSYYNLGYQIVRYSRETYGVEMWDQVIDYVAKYPFTVLPKTIALKKYFDTSADKLLDQTMEQMREHWASLPKRENSTVPIVGADPKNYITYRSPQYINDSTVYALKSDYDRASRIVAVDPRDGSEQIVCYTGSINTPLSYGNGRLLWSELRESTFWERKVDSKLCYYDLSTKKSGTIDSDDSAIFPIYIGEELAYVSYTHSGDYTLVVGERSMPIRGASSVHGLCYDAQSSTIALILLGAEGMWIAGADIETQSLSQITAPSRVTISNLAANSGVLSFGSIASGYDEVHTLDLATGVERQATTSRYGSFSPSAITAEGDLFVTTYSTEGYILSRQSAESATDNVVDYSLLPKNIVNLPSTEWNIINVDSVAISIANAEEVECCEHTETQGKKYSKLGHIVNVHSWLPVGFDPFSVIEEDNFDFALGATVMSQSLLSSLVASVSYQYTENGHGAIADLEYSALPVKIELEAEYGDGKQLIYGLQNTIYGEKTKFSSTARLYLPAKLSDGAHIKTLTPIVEYAHSNSIYYSAERETMESGLGQMGVAISYSDYLRSAYRDILPRWGYFVKATSISAPFSMGGDMSELWAFKGGVYLPSFLPHHSIVIQGAVHYQEYSKYNSYYKDLYPRGADYNIAAYDYYATSIDYQFPLAYPDWGINSIVHFTRLRLDLNYDYAYFTNVYGSWQSVDSYGATLYIDMHPLRIPANTTTLGISIYKPSDSKSFVAGVNLSLPI